MRIVLLGDSLTWGGYGGSFAATVSALLPEHQIIPAGQQIGLMVFSSDRDFTLWPTPGTQLTVDLAETSLQLPVVGGAAAWSNATQPAAKEKQDSKTPTPAHP